MSKVTLPIAVVFAFLEGLAVYQAWFDRDNETFDGMAPGSFSLYTKKGNDGEAIKRLMDFYALWIGGNKFIMSLLIVICCASRDARTRLLACLSMIVGTCVYFWQQSSVYESMDNNNELVVKGKSKEVSDLIMYVILPMWIVATICEIRCILGARTMMNTKINKKN